MKAERGFIASACKRRELGQREAVEIFGSGVNAVARFENGKTCAPLAWVKLLKVLERHPDCWGEVRAAGTSVPAPLDPPLNAVFIGFSASMGPIAQANNLGK